MYKSSTCFASFRVVPFKLKKIYVPVPTASMGNSLIVNIRQDHRSVQKKSHQMMKVRRITSLTTTLMMILLPNKSFTITNCEVTVFLNCYKKKHLFLFFHILCHESCFIHVRCFILVLLFTVCVTNTITLYQKVQATSSINI